ncbi:MAG: peptidoglycan DD-metalloendopeptidase family protein [Candidatus Spechtbacterales bacterium]
MALLVIAAVAVLAGFGGGGVINVYADEIEDLQREIEEKQRAIDELERKAGEYQEHVDDQQHYAATLRGQINEFNAEISGLERRIALTQAKIGRTQLEIKKTELEIAERVEGVRQSHEQMAEIVRQVHKKESESMVEILLSHRDLSDFFIQLEVRETLQEGLSERLTELKRLTAELEERRGVLGDERDRLAAEREEVGGQRIVLASQRQRQQGLLSETREEEARYQALLSQAEAQRKAINEEVYNLERRLREALDPGSVPPDSGDFIWPAANFRLTQGYGCLRSSWARRSYSSCDGGAGGWHNGLDLAAPLGTPIYAVNDGRIIGVGNNPRGYGLWVAIEHANGLVSSVGHLSAQLVSVGQFVTKGQTIARMGSTGFSTGSHTHFIIFAPRTYQEVRSRISGTVPIGATVEPRNYLP